MTLLKAVPSHIHGEDVDLSQNYYGGSLKTHSYGVKIYSENYFTYFTTLLILFIHFGELFPEVQ